MYGCESWTVKKAERRRIDAFEVWCWRRLLKVPWTARRSNQSILKQINPRCSLEGLTLKLKFQYFGHLMQKADSLEKTLMLGKIEGWRRRSWWWTGRPGMLWFMGLQRVRHHWATELNWTDTRSLNPFEMTCHISAVRKERRWICKIGKFSHDRTSSLECNLCKVNDLSYFIHCCIPRA